MRRLLLVASALLAPFGAQHDGRGGEGKGACDTPVLLTPPGHSGRPTRVRLVPGEWAQPERGDIGWAFLYRGGKELRYERDGPRIFVNVDGKPRQFVGVIVAGEHPDELPALRKAIEDRVNPLTIWCDAEQLRLLPPVPQEIEVALQVKGDTLAGLPEFLARCPGVTALHLAISEGPPAPELLALLARLPRLNSLHIAPGTNVEGEPLIEDLALFGNMTRLEVLCLQERISLDNLRPLARLTNLRSLNLCSMTEDPGPVDLRPLVDLANLVHLELSPGRDVTDIGPLGALAGLTKLRLYFDGQTKFHDLSPLDRLASLEELHIRSLPEASDIRFFESLPSLAEVRLFGLGQVTDTKPLAGLKKLASLTLYDCPKLAELTGLGPLTELRELSIIHQQLPGGWRHRATCPDEESPGPRHPVFR